MFSCSLCWSTQNLPELLQISAGRYVLWLGFAGMKHLWFIAIATISSILQNPINMAIDPREHRQIVVKCWLVTGTHRWGCNRGGRRRMAILFVTEHANQFIVAGVAAI